MCLFPCWCSSAAFSYGGAVVPDRTMARVLFLPLVLLTWLHYAALSEANRPGGSMRVRVAPAPSGWCNPSPLTYWHGFTRWLLIRQTPWWPQWQFVWLRLLTSATLRHGNLLHAATPWSQAKMALNVLARRCNGWNRGSRLGRRTCVGLSVARQQTTVCQLDQLVADREARLSTKARLDYGRVKP